MVELALLRCPNANNAFASLLNIEAIDIDVHSVVGKFACRKTNNHYLENLKSISVLLMWVWFVNYSDP